MAFNNNTNSVGAFTVRCFCVVRAGSSSCGSSGPSSMPCSRGSDSTKRLPAHRRVPSRLARRRPGRHRRRGGPRPRPRPSASLSSSAPRRQRPRSPLPALPVLRLPRRHRRPPRIRRTRLKARPRGPRRSPAGRGPGRRRIFGSSASATSPSPRRTTREEAQGSVCERSSRRVQLLTQPRIRVPVAYHYGYDFGSGWSAPKNKTFYQRHGTHWVRFLSVFSFLLVASPK